MNSEKPMFANFWTRLLAHNIDLIPILILLYSISFIAPNNGYDIIIFGAIYLFYYVGFEASKWHATPGKKWAKIKIYNTDGNSVRIHQTFIRNISKIFSLLLFFGGFIMIVFDSKKRGLHDFIGGTIVLFDED
jgi:uncharacterized RDD family membrane protein YckC